MRALRRLLRQWLRRRAPPSTPPWRKIAPGVFVRDLGAADVKGWLAERRGQLRGGRAPSARVAEAKAAPMKSDAVAP